MSTRTLDRPRHNRFNLLVYDDNGTLLAQLDIPKALDKRYISVEMFRRYCGEIFIIPDHAPSKEWTIFNLKSDGSTGDRLCLGRRALMPPGKYIVLDLARNPIEVRLTDRLAPRRVRTSDKSTAEQGRTERERLQTHFRNSLRQRDQGCALSGTRRIESSEKPYRSFDATHIFPISSLSQWNRQNFRRFLTDRSSASLIGESGLFSPENGLLLRKDLHALFDEFVVGVDPDADYRIICFEEDEFGLGGKRLAISAINPASEAHRVSPDLLRWHLIQCLYKNMKINTEPQEVWEDDLGSDDLAEILEQPDAAQRMEVELFTRLGGLVA